MANIEDSTIQARGVSERRTLTVTLSVGALIGVVGWLLALGLENWIVKPFFCQTAVVGTICSNGSNVAWATAMVIVSFFGLIALVRGGVFRPLLVVLASLAVLWGVASWLSPLPWWQGALWHGALTALALALFGWVARINNFLLSLIVTIVLVLLARLVVISV